MFRFGAHLSDERQRRIPLRFSANVACLAGGRCGSWCVPLRVKLDREEPSSNRRLSTRLCSTCDSPLGYGRTIFPWRNIAFHIATESTLDSTHAYINPWRRGFAPPPMRDSANQRRSNVYVFPLCREQFKYFVIATFHNIKIYLFTQWTRVTF